MASTDRSIFFSDQFVISCGTVSLDVTTSRVLLIRLRKTGEFVLPKGRKDLGETLEETAKRETFEETGVRVELLPMTSNTLATTPSSATHRPHLVTEPIGVTQRFTRQGVLKIIFWYLAAGDSAAVPEGGTQQEDEFFDTVWVDFGRVGSTLSFENDRGIAQAAIDAVRGRLMAAS